MSKLAISQQAVMPIAVYQEVYSDAFKSGAATLWGDAPNSLGSAQYIFGIERQQC
ncbi:hypothetical protein [Vibrio variabilis]|uniref:hypothetical protein n=1 Tax=Vibrio variabilis TaxID=990271 RepID=UPI000A4E83C5|nr:hypothetical protein [Vibrio variabilis]